jgi:hypothetical protein
MANSPDSTRQPKGRAARNLEAEIDVSRRVGGKGRIDDDARVVGLRIRLVVGEPVEGDLAARPGSGVYLIAEIDRAARTGEV